MNGTAAYPPPDPGVGGGMMALLSPLYPRSPIDVSRWLQLIPEDGSVPGMPGWKWIHTPGHTPSQFSLWREADRTIIAADAFITTAQESAYAVAIQRPELHGPPMYFTQNFQQARDSVQRLAALEPELVITGHGPALRGSEMRQALHALADNFDEVVVPDKGSMWRIRRPPKAEPLMMCNKNRVTHKGSTPKLEYSLCALRRGFQSPALNLANKIAATSQTTASGIFKSLGPRVTTVKSRGEFSS